MNGVAFVHPLPTNWLTTIGPILADYYLLATGLLAIVALLMRLDKQPARRLAVAWGAMICLLALAVICSLPNWPRVRLLPALKSSPVAARPMDRAQIPAVSSARPTPANPAELGGNEPNDSPTVPSPLAPGQPAPAAVERATPADSVLWHWRHWESWSTVIVALFLAGVATIAARLLWGAVQSKRLCRRASPAPAILQAELARIIGPGRRQPALLVSAEIGNAAALGILRPTILLPAEIVAVGSIGSLRAALAHEWAHVRNGDLWLLALGRCLLLILFAHPLYWWLRRAIRDNQELLADAAAAGHTNRHDYAQELIAWARIGAQSARPRMLTALGIWERPSQLTKRIARLLDESFAVDLRCPLGWRVGGWAVVGIVAIGLSLFTVSQAANSGDEEPSSDGSRESASPSIRVAQASDPRPSNADPKPRNEGDLLTISGQVLAPDGKPFAGAKIYATTRSAESRPLILKDPNQPPFQVEEREGKPPLLTFVHPKLLEVIRKLNIEATLSADDPRLQSEEFRRESARLLPEIYESHPEIPPPVRATTANDGQFRFEIATADLKSPFEEDISVIAVADGLAPAWNLSKAPGTLADVQLRLVNDMPIHGRIVDTQGKPVSNGKVKMGAMLASPEGTSDFWVETVMAYASGNTGKFNKLFVRNLKEYQFFGHRLQLFPDEFTTDADGRFTITGVGAGRALFGLEVSGDGFAKDRFSVMTRPGAGIDLSIFRDPKPVPHQYRTYGATFEHVVQSVQLVRGTVRDLATGKPVPNVQVAAWAPEYSDAFTDAEGRYQLVGLARADRYNVTAWPWPSRNAQLPYITTTKAVQAQDDQGRVVADFDLVRGVILRGRLMDPRTGKGVAGANIQYAAFKGNPRLAVFYYPGNPLYADPRPNVFVHISPLNAPRMEQTHATSGPDGSFDVIVLPGRGVLAAYPPDGKYQRVELTELKRDKILLKETVPNLDGQPFNALRLIDVPDGAQEMNVELEVEEAAESLTNPENEPDGEPKNSNSPAP